MSIFIIREREAIRDSDMGPGAARFTQINARLRFGSIHVRFQLVWFCFGFASALVRPTLVCTSGALRWSSRCLQLAPLSSRKVTCTSSKTPHVMLSFEYVPDSVYVAAARRTAAWRTPTVAKFLRHLPLAFKSA